MAKFQSPMLGYNNNIRHKNRVFHIQTEDSGVKHPHIITHLFMDGGRILKSVKKSYAEHVGVEGMSETVRVLMKEQHKAMFIALREGQFDDLFESAGPRKAADGAPSSPTLEAFTATEATEATDLPPTSDPSLAPATDPGPAPEDEPMEAGPLTIDESRLEVSPTLVARPEALPAPRLVLAEPEGDDAPTTTRQPARAPDVGATERPAASSGALVLDFAALERGARERPAASRFATSERPPGPRSLAPGEALSRGGYRSADVEPQAEHRAPARSAPPAAARTPSGRPPTDARYAPARPAAIFGGTQRPPPSSSLFGDDVVGDKSLDEVILSYLAEDLETPRGK